MRTGTGRSLAARSHHQRIFFIAFAGLVSTAVSLALPVTIGMAIDGGGLRLAAVLIAVAVACDLFDSFAATAYAATETARLRHGLVRHVVGVGPHRLLALSTGDLVSRISGLAPQAAQRGFSRVTLGLSVLPPIGSLIMLAVLDLRLAAVFLAGAGLVALVLRSYSRRTTDASAGYQRAQSAIAGHLTEALDGARTIAAAGTLDLERRRILHPLRELSAHGRQMWHVLARSTAQGAVTGPLALIGVLAAGGLLLGQGALSPGELFAAGRYAVVGAGLGSLTGVLSGLARARVAADRLGEVLSIEPMPYGHRSTSDGSGGLDFAGVTVDGVLRDVSFSIPGGACAAVVGRSGAGKSVLAALAARLRDPDRGEVRLDGVPLSALRHDDLRSAVGCAFERPVLWGRTVTDAIVCGRTPMAASSMATAAQAHDFVIRLPMGYNTPLADAPMSGGEAQRLGLARALAATKVLVLDDATSSLDMVTEKRLSDALLAVGRTRMIVTHRVTTATRADMVVWLAGGGVWAVGSHEQLWADPAYRAVFA